MTKLSDLVPLMYQAQISERGKIQYIGEPEKAHKWVEQWNKGVSGQNVPQFNSDFIETKEYRITWRFITNSGQDETIIRPVIGAKGYPYYPGASLKGAFKRACTPQEAERYCGGKAIIDGKKETKPGLLRFHGAYLKDDRSMNNKLVDVVHPQEDWQVKSQANHSGKIQISLYKPTLIFGISCSKPETLQPTDWQRIKEILKIAIERGIGSRTSAGYGQIVASRRHNRLLKVGLTGKGLASLLPHPSEPSKERAEFRPNMFKAALRGHTLRLFGGVTDKTTAEALTKELWGGFTGREPIVGLLGVAFSCKPDQLDIDEYKYIYRSEEKIIPTYDLSEGELSLLCMRSLSEEHRQKLGLLATQLIKFALLLGGFGKSWRRVDHREVWKSYLTDSQNRNINPLIGCHWKLAPDSHQFYVPVNEIGDITKFLKRVTKIVKEWVEFTGKQLSSTPADWREAWHPNKVQVWGRFANNIADSEAVRWFHSCYSGERTIKATELTGFIRRDQKCISRIWHRMYPCYHDIEIEGQNKANRVFTGKYVELLTIFPDDPDNQFFDFLRNNSSFSQVFPSPQKNR